jgi:Cu+-exporting ATPase
MTTTEPGQSVELIIGGMTCASCAARVEKKLNRMDGVTATVNYATEKAKVTFADGITTDDLVATVEKTGYTASVPAPTVDSPDSQEPDELKPLRDRLFASIALAVPVIALGMIPALQFDFWQWASLTLAFPVVTWAAWPFHKAAWTNLRHGAATMDTLISLGVVSAVRAVRRRRG